LIPALHT